MSAGAFLAKAGLFLLLAGEALAVGTPEIKVVVYNLENYLNMTRRIDGRLRSDAGKPDEEKKAAVRIISDLHPDLLALMEIGDQSQLDDLQRRLRKAGTDLPYGEIVQGADPKRHLALLSRFPIVDRHSLGDVPLKLDQLTLHSPRGILDVTLEPYPGYTIRLMAIHLKAKLEVTEYDERKLRESEAVEVRRHIRDILKSDPNIRLMLVGDFNETKNEESLRRILGKPAWPDAMQALPLCDERGEFWTEYWSAADTYSRIDYMLVTKRLESEIDLGKSGIARPTYWNQASDHCPLFVTIKTSLP